MISLRKRLLNNRPVSVAPTSKEVEEYTGGKKKEKQGIDVLRIAKFYRNTGIHGIKWYFFLLACFPMIFLLHAVFFTVGSQKHLRRMYIPDKPSSPVLSSDQKQKPLYYLSVVAIFKNEADVLKEWIDHYNEQGVDHFFLVNNNSTDDFLSVLAPFGETVTVINDSRKHAQREIMTELFHDIKNQTEWIMSIDIDEYVYVRQSALEHYGANISSAVSTLEKEDPKICQLLVHWTMFGSSGHVVQPPSIRKNFTRCSPLRTEQGKFIIKASLVKKYDVHLSRCLSGHFFQGDDILALNHYAIMSWERFKRVKMTRGDVSQQEYEGVRDEGYFKSYDELYSNDTCLELASRSDIKNIGNSVL